jgi:hypothetical protein
VLGSSLNFKEPPNSSSLNISESKNHWFSSLKKKSRIKELLLAPVISKNLKESMIFIKKIQQRTGGSLTNFFYLYFFKNHSYTSKLVYTPKFENWQVSGYMLY